MVNEILRVKTAAYIGKTARRTVVILRLLYLSLLKRFFKDLN